MLEWWERALVQVGIMFVATVAAITLWRLTLNILYIFDYV